MRYFKKLDPINLFCLYSKILFNNNYIFTLSIYIFELADIYQILDTQINRIPSHPLLDNADHFLKNKNKSNNKINFFIQTDVT